MIRVKEIMTKSVVTVNPSDDLYIVKEKMIRHNINRVVVIENERIVSILTRKDIVRTASELLHKEVDKILVSEAMTPNPITIDPETPVSEVARIMLEENISSLIVTENDRLTGIVTKTDICRFFAERCQGLFKVSDFMTREVITTSQNSSIFRAIDLMREKNISRVIVTDDNRPVGIITVTDVSLISAIFNPQAIKERGEPLIVVMEKKGLVIPPSPMMILSLTARDVMTSKLICVMADDDLSQAAKLMIDNRISGLPVIDETGGLCGVITKTDITRATAQLKT